MATLATARIKGKGRTFPKLSYDVRKNLNPFKHEQEQISPNNVSTIFTCGEARRSMDHNWPRLLRLNHLKEAFTGQRSMGTWVIEVNEFNFEVSFALRGHLKAPITQLEATCTWITG